MYGLLGKKLAHSYSTILHEELGDTPYTLFQVAEGELDAFMQNRRFSGINVTIPYKQAVIPYCSSLHPTAAEIGAVNTIVNQGGTLAAYNSDAAGFAYLLASNGICPEGKTVLVLGSGGTSSTAQYVLRKWNAKEVLVASRAGGSGFLRYEEALLHPEVDIVLNTTPVGMYPHNGESPLNLDAFPHLSAVVDVIYNPLRTELIQQAQRRNLIAAGGLPMLAEQARVSSFWFTGQQHPPETTQKLCKKLLSQLSNIVLVGMPGCGKSSLGAELARQTGRKFLDLDLLIEKKDGRKIERIFAEDGEDFFRRLESEAAAEAGKQSGLVIATGGGVVLRDENIASLRQNGFILWIDCPAAQLPLGEGRPLAKKRSDLAALEEKRRPLYTKAADATIAYHSDFSENLARLQRSYHTLLENTFPHPSEETAIEEFL